MHSLGAFASRHKNILGFIVMVTVKILLLCFMPLNYSFTPVCTSYIDWTYQYGEKFYCGENGAADLSC